MNIKTAETRGEKPCFRKNSPETTVFYSLDSVTAPKADIHEVVVIKPIFLIKYMVYPAEHIGMLVRDFHSNVTETWEIFLSFNIPIVHSWSAE